jgi:cell wall-associated NlpC family hydrolase
VGARSGPDYSGYLTVDPRQALGGNFTGSYGAQQGFGPAAPTAAGGAMNDFLRAVDQGQPVSTSMLPTQGGFHDWLYNQMMGLPQPGDQNGAALAGSWVWSDGTTHSLPSSGSAGGGIVNEAKQYLNVKYVWGGIPTKTQDPFQTGWDCSGFTYFMDQKYGDGTLPQGSHYQYQYAQQTGRLFTDTSQLKPGDLVFFNTGDTQGAGADLNPAGHVGIYLGNDQIISAMNPSMGTVLSSFSGFSSPFIGAMHMSSWK